MDTFSHWPASQLGTATVKEKKDYIVEHDLNGDDYVIENRERSLAKYVEPTRPIFPRVRLFLGRLTEEALIRREGRLVRMREEENFRSEVQQQHHRVYLVYNAEVAEHDAAIMADVKKRVTEAKARILMALDRQSEKARAAQMIDDALEARQVQDEIDAIYRDVEPVPVTPQAGSVNGARNPGKTQKPPEKESLV